MKQSVRHNKTVPVISETEQNRFDEIESGWHDDVLVKMF